MEFCAHARFMEGGNGVEYIESYFHTPSEEELNSSVFITWGGHRICMPDHKIGPRVLENYKIVLVVKGRGALEQGDKRFFVGAGDLFALFPGIKHLYYADPEDPWEIMWVSFNGRACGEIVNSIHLSPSLPVIVGGSSPGIIEIFYNIIRSLENAGELFSMRATGYLYLLFSEILSMGKTREKMADINKKEDLIKKTLTFIELNYYNHIDVGLLCGYVNYSRSYFSRLFKMKTGVSIPEYINNVRIKRAKLLLKSTDLSINEVARSVGFDDSFYFSKIFKKITGLSPTDYKMMTTGFSDN